MPIVEMHFREDQEAAWPDLESGEKVVTHVTEEITVVGLPHGMTSGAPSVMFRFDLPEGVLLAQTSLRALLTLADAMRSRYGDPRTSS